MPFALKSHRAVDLGLKEVRKNDHMRQCHRTMTSDAKRRLSVWSDGTCSLQPMRGSYAE